MQNERYENKWTKRYTAVKEVKAKTQGFKVRIEHHVRRKIHGWCKAATSEVSGVGLVEKKGSEFLIYDAVILPQKCSSGFTQLDEGEVDKFLMRLRRRGGAINDMKFWWHTHYNFGTFWSSTDVDMARTWVEHQPWFISTVINQAGDELTRLDFSNPVELCVDEIPLIGAAGRPRKRHNYKRDIARFVKPLTGRKWQYSESDESKSGGSDWKTWDYTKPKWLGYEGYNSYEDGEWKLVEGVWVRENANFKVTKEEKEDKKPLWENKDYDMMDNEQWLREMYD